MTREQFITHVEATREALCRFLVALCCGDSALADDLAQEAYLKAWMATDSLTDTAKFRSWIFRIAYNTFINHRRSARHHADYVEAADIPAPEGGDTPFRYQDLYDALRRLPPKERSSVLLFYLEGYSVKEIAAIEGAGEAAIRQHLHRGRNHLRGLLTNQ